MSDTTIAVSDENRERFMSNKPSNITQDRFMTKLLDIWEKLFREID